MVIDRMAFKKDNPAVIGLTDLVDWELDWLPVNQVNQ